MEGHEKIIIENWITLAATSLFLFFYYIIIVLSHYFSSFFILRVHCLLHHRPHQRQSPLSISSDPCFHPHPIAPSIIMEAYTSGVTGQPTDLGQVYLEMLLICQPFYELPVSSDDPGETPRQGGFYIHPRLEDGLPSGDGCDKYENPQDPTSNFHHESGCSSQPHCPPPTQKCVCPSSTAGNVHREHRPRIDGRAR
jgi:hypothetical protein